MTPTPELAGRVLLVVGALLVMLDVVANRYHSRRFREYVRASENGDLHAPIDLYHDRRLDVAERVMMYAGPLGICALGFGVVLLLAS